MERGREKKSINVIWVPQITVKMCNEVIQFSLRTDMPVRTVWALQAGYITSPTGESVNRIKSRRYLELTAIYYTSKLLALKPI